LNFENNFVIFENNFVIFENNFVIFENILKNIFCF